jgi:thiol-disulfide isomerase/thioredoxin
LTINAGIGKIGPMIDKNMNSTRPLFLVILLSACHLFSGSDTFAQNAGQSVALKGQVVCSQCWFEADRKTTLYGTAEDIECAVDCDKQGISKALAVTDNGETTLYLLEYGKLKKTRDGWLSYITKNVEATGQTRKDGEKRWLKVDSLTVVSPPSTAPPAAPSDAALPADAPELVLKDLAGMEQRLSAYRGKIVILNFWATWCVPCQKEMPVLVKLQNSYAAWNVQVIGASADEAARRSLVVDFTRKHKINFPVWLGATTDDMRSYGLGSVLPGTVIISRDGKMIQRIKSVVTEKGMEKILDDLLAEPKSDTGHEHPHQETVGARRSSSVPS